MDGNQKKGTNQKLRDLCSEITRPAGFRNRIKLFHHLSQVSPFPHLVGFSGLPSYEIYAEKRALVSADHNFLLRILHDQLSGRLEAHLLHPLEHKYRYAFVVLESLNREFLTNLHGWVTLGQIDEDRSLSPISVCPPSAVFELKPGGEPVQVYAEEGLRDCRLRAEFFSVGPQPTLKVQTVNLPEGVEIKRMVLVIDAEETLIAVPQKGLAFYELPEGARSLRIYLYE
ncbi:MAG: hypothetical protein OP8BY_1191 [Candidatus Saccharicenans subterraneus]|uniref:Uncharacterized protein n=1 Tax=Candidatus Saccharicenans subterraneus TaxID=2508984 RepID=A0A3E2BPD1_9BACT|nr:MAG: hypothetical protein OP8BY_1191 [Candidatus Saccharicenans subterraneum]